MRVMTLNVTCGWPYSEEGPWMDLDGEGGIFSPGFQEVFAADSLPSSWMDMDTSEEELRAYILAKLNSLGHKDANGQPIVWTEQHYYNWDNGCKPHHGGWIGWETHDLEVQDWGRK